MIFDKTMDLLSKIKKEAFDDLEVDTSGTRRISGWMTPSFVDNLQIALKYVKKPEITIIEVGSWQGLSANVMAQACKKLEQQAKIVCIDTWLGSVEHQDTIGRVSGYPSVYKEFIEITKFLKNDDVIYPFPISSTEGACYLKKKGVKADLIYVDGSHEYESVLTDAKLYWELLAPGGVMIFDDYSWEGVKKAVDAFFADKKQVTKLISQEQAVVFMKCV